MPVEQVDKPEQTRQRCKSREGPTGWIERLAASTALPEELVARSLLASSFDYERNSDADEARLMTLRVAKGLEFSRARLAGVEGACCRAAAAWRKVASGKNAA